MRTYAYPTLLYFLSFFSWNKSDDFFSIFVAVIQYLWFAGALAWLVTTVDRQNKHLALAIAFALGCNPFILSLVTETLTESPTTILLLLLTTLALKMTELQNKYALLVTLFIGNALVDVALMVRPANIVFTLAWHFAAFLFVSNNKTFLNVRIRFIIFYFTGAFLSACAITAPQAWYNFQHHNVFSIFPTCNLSKLQMSYGLKLWRYDSFVSSDGIGHGLYYANPLFDQNTTPKEPLRWYFENPYSGARTIFEHVFSLFDVQHLFTYIRNRELLYQKTVNAISWWLIWIALLQLCIWLIKQVQTHSLKLRDIAISHSFFALTVMGVLAMNSIVAVETRFGIVPLSLCWTTGVYWLLRVRNYRVNRVIIQAVLAGILAFACVYHGSDIVSLASLNPPPSLPVNLDFNCP